MAFGVATLIFGDPLFILIVLAIYRIILEFFAVGFRVAEDIRAITEHQTPLKAYVYQMGEDFLATRIERAWLRWLTITICLVLPLLVTYARLYRGMHHVTDVAVGMLNGLLCALLAYAWYRLRDAAASSEEHTRTSERVEAG